MEQKQAIEQASVQTLCRALCAVHARCSLDRWLARKYGAPGARALLGESAQAGAGKRAGAAQRTAAGWRGAAGQRGRQEQQLTSSSQQPDGAGQASRLLFEFAAARARWRGPSWLACCSLRESAGVFLRNAPACRRWPSWRAKVASTHFGARAGTARWHRQARQPALAWPERRAPGPASAHARPALGARRQLNNHQWPGSDKQPARQFAGH